MPPSHHGQNFRGPMQATEEFVVPLDDLFEAPMNPPLRALSKERTGSPHRSNAGNKATEASRNRLNPT